MAGTQQPSRVEQHIQKAKALLTGNDYAQALIVSQAVLLEVPQNKDALYLEAVCRRYLKQPEEALEALSRLERSDPQYARLYQERGHCHRLLRNPAAALAAYERAVSLNPALPASWKALLELYSQEGRAAGAERAGASLQYLMQLPASLVSAASHLHEGNLCKAELLCRQFLKTNGHHVEAMRLLADIGLKLNVLDDAEFLLESCVLFAPSHHAARFDYVNVLHRRQKYAAAHREAALLRKANPGNRRFEVLYANQCVALGQSETALEIYSTMLRECPNDPEMHLARGNTLKTVGQQREAIAAYRAAYSARPGYGESYWSLANLKTYRFSDDELTRMREQLALPSITDVDRYHLCFALGKALEDCGEYTESFSFYKLGNALKKVERRYVPEYMERDLALQAAVCTSELFAAKSGGGCGMPDPIFIVGLPRSGSTLLEQILASHSQVDGTHELANILALAHRLDRHRRVDEDPSYPASLWDLTAEQLRALGEQYLDETRVYRKGRPFFIDKMPNNFRHIGLIHLILPNAKIIDARRDAMACCFSCFKQLFVEGQEFTYGLEDVGRYYRSYVALMDHWDAVLPGKILRVRYEDVVADLEYSVRRVLQFCGLDLEPACIEFHRTGRTVRTASSEQVRQPLFREGLDQWRHFEPNLGPLRAVLGTLARE